MKKHRYKNESCFIRPSAFHRKRWVRAAMGVLFSLLTALTVVILAFMLMFYTPFFPHMRTQYILMTINTSNPWLATSFFSKATIDQVLNDNRVESPNEETDPDLVQIVTRTTVPSAITTTGSNSTTSTSGTSSTTSIAATSSTSASATQTTAPPLPAGSVQVVYEQDGIVIHQIQGDSYVARMVQVADPSRVKLELSHRFLSFGEKLAHLCQRTKAIVGINAGGFNDPKGSGNGGTPTYLCVKDYKIVYTDGAAKHRVIGLNEDNILVLGEFTNEEIIEKRIRDAVSFGPFLIVNGKPAKTYGAAGGKDPRAAIGQKADGTILLLTIDGRQPGMEGGNMRTIIDLMQQYDAVTAANLDGGSSTTMVLNGKIINKPCSLYGPRYLPNAWIVQ